MDVRTLSPDVAPPTTFTLPRMNDGRVVEGTAGPLRSQRLTRTLHGLKRVS